MLKGAKYQKVFSCVFHLKQERNVSNTYLNNIATTKRAKSFFEFSPTFIVDLKFTSTKIIVPIAVFLPENGGKKIKGVLNILTFFQNR